MHLQRIPLDRTKHYPYIFRKKSLDKLKNYFQSPADAGLIKIYSKIDMLLNEQRKQRADLATLLRMSNEIINDIRLYKQSDTYYQSKLPLEDSTNTIPEEEA